MKKKELVSKVSVKSQVSEEECRRVIQGLEEILTEEFSDSGSVGTAFDKVYKLMSFIKNNKKVKNRAI